MDDLTGQTIKGYELREKIGVGGFGAVYRAYQPSVGRDVAIKIILPHFANDPNFRRRFETEARLVARLEHFNIVPLYDYWHEEGGNAYLVMRWLRGGSVRQMLGQGPLPVQQVARIVGQIAQALTAAHQAGIVHRDLKPDNILLDEKRNAYLGDFGIAKDLINSANLTASSTLGSPAYVAPEQFFGEEVSPLADIYSLGITLYECLTGQHPFPNQYMKHLTEPIPAPSVQEASLSPQIDAVILRATEKDPAGRYPSAVSLAQAFERAVSGTSVTPDFDGISTVAGPGRGSATEARDPANQMGQTLVLVAEEPGSAVPPDPDEAPGDQRAVLIATESAVPWRPRKLIGRADLLATINGHLDDGQRVLLQGMGGMGKTALAAETVVARVAKNQGPVLWLRAGSDEITVLVEALVRPLDRNLAITQSDLKVARIRTLLDEYGIKLIVLDDAWNDGALGQLLEVLPPRMPLLVTSRHRYPMDRIVDVGELELANALELLNYHAATSYGANDEPARELCQRLGYHPFALEIAGKTIQVDDLRAQDLLKRLGDTPHTITMQQGFGEAGRAGVSELLSASLDQLDDETRAVFLAFGALAVPEATAQLLELCLKRQVEAALTTLGRRGLARRVRRPESELVTYRIHGLAHSYARSKTDLTQDAVIGAVQEYVKQHVNDLDALDAERTNILKSAAAAHAAGQHTNLIAIMHALTVESAYLQARGHDALFREQMDHAITVARPAGEAQAAVLHALLSKRGNVAYEQGKLLQARANYEEALALARSLELPDREVILLCVLSKVQADQGETEAAEKALNDARDRAEAAQDDRLISRVLENQGYYYAMAQQDFEAARQVFEQQVALAERVQDVERLFFALCNLGAAEVELGQLEQALEHLQRSIDLAQQENNLPWEAEALANMGMIYHQQANREQAQTSFTRSLQLFHSSGNAARINDVSAYMSAAGYDTTLPSDQ